MEGDRGPADQPIGRPIASFFHNISFAKMPTAHHDSFGRRPEGLIHTRRNPQIRSEIKLPQMSAGLDSIDDSREAGALCSVAALPQTGFAVAQ